MNAIKFEINSDGDFGYDILFTTLVHEEETILIKRMIDNLRIIHNSFRTSRPYVNKINESIGKFLTAYDDVSVTHYYDKRYSDLWFVRNGNGFEFSFYIDNGNQQFYILEDCEVLVQAINGGFEILEKK